MDDRQEDSGTEQVRLRLLRLIREQDFRPGERIGTERGLSSTLGVSRPALRKALDCLESERLIRRSMGRTGGVFADDGKIQRHLNTVQGVPDMVRRQGFSVETQVLEAVMAQPAPSERRALRLEREEPVLRIRRLRLVGGESWSLDTSVLPARRYPGLLSEDLTGSLYALLTRRYQLIVDRAEETVEATASSPEAAALLKVAPGAGLLKISRVTYDPHGAPAEYANDFFRADRTRIHMQRVGTNWKRAGRS
ncbi:GntR family transcriptional regulator [Nesterenkonia flava]|uniref:GntR family transcriptional regulator n=1 Tax=Nesterenkonia flava TaxID=469799 RepID=A0ABU1FUB1_9MICC|nr:GntR family transcriptional regulator [Nesterenkonia flava]MDR5712254.1 GntR family transcriptional regulator [Nesterenkonia flava]